jgi:hypothetical protein
MNRPLVIVLSLVLFSSCKKDNVEPVNASNTSATTTSGTDTFDPAKATLLKQGTLTGIGHTASGVVKLYDTGTSKVVYFESYSSQEGPDLKVYLSKDINANEYLKLGALKSTSGVQSYTVPPNTDVSNYIYVHIWCERFTVVFARAEIK